MFIEQAYSKKFDFIKYLPIPIIFLLLMLLNYAAVLVLNLDVDKVIRDEIARKGANRVFFETMLPLAVFLIMLLAWVKFINKQTIRSLTTARKKVDWKRIFFSFGLWSVLTIGMTVIAYYAEPQNFEINFEPVPFAVLAVIAIIMVPMQTSFEEYMFRGYLMQGIGIISRSRFVALLTTSVMFGLMHIANPEIGKLGYILLVYYIGTGFFLGIITLMDDGMELALGFHAANNLITALLVTSDWTALQTDSILKDNSVPDAGFDILLPVFIVFPVLIFIFSKKYNWSGWRDKLTGKVILPETDNETAYSHD